MLSCSDYRSISILTVNSVLSIFTILSVFSVLTVIDGNITCISELEGVTYYITLVVLNRSYFLYIVIALKCLYSSLERRYVAVNLCDLVNEEHVRSPCRDSEHCAIHENELYIFVIVSDALEHGITVLTGLTCSFAETLPCSLVVIRNIPIVTLDLELRCDTIGTCCTVLAVDCLSENLIAFAVKQILAVDSPVPAAVLGLLHSHDWSMSGSTGLTLLAVVDLHATALGECDFVSDSLTAFNDWDDAVDIVVVLHHIDDGLQ